MSIVLLLQMKGGWDRWGWLFMLGCAWGDRGRLSSYSFCFFSCAFAFFCLAFSVPLFRWLEHDGSCVCFFVFSLFVVSGPFN